jgi:DNA-binding NarL/FixJ family response regulator
MTNTQDLEEPTAEPIHVLIADDHDVVRRGIRSLLSTIADVTVVGEAATGDEAVAGAVELVPDVVLLDLQMPGGHGLDATRQITTSLPNVAVVILTMYEDVDSIDAALRAGARGYLLKGASQNDVVHAIRAAARGHVILGPGAAERMLERLNAPSSGPSVFPELTDREREVLRLVAEGHNNGTIGKALHLAPKTVANHVSNILTKLQIADRAEAIVAARRAGLADDAWHERR